MIFNFNFSLWLSVYLLGSQRLVLDGETVALPAALVSDAVCRAVLCFYLFFSKRKVLI